MCLNRRQIIQRLSSQITAPNLLNISIFTQDNISSETLKLIIKDIQRPFQNDLFIKYNQILSKGSTLQNSWLSSSVSFFVNLYVSNDIIVGLANIQIAELMFNLKPKIINHETQPNNKIVYVLEVTDELSGKSKITKLRYSQFKNLHQELLNVVTKLKLHIILPEFPSRKLFGSTNKSEQLIFERKKQLNSYLIDLLSIQKLHCLDLIKKYFIPTQKKEVEHTKESHQINMQICIDRYTLVEDVVIYYVRLRDLNSHQQWTFKTRYSELRNVHQALQQSKIKNLPTFPKKKIFGITNESPENIEKRREQLEKYFNQIFNSKEVLRSDAIRYFIDESKKQAQRDKQLEALKKKKNQKN